MGQNVSRQVEKIKEGKFYPQEKTEEEQSVEDFRATLATAAEIPREQLLSESKDHFAMGFMAGFLSGVTFSPLSRLKVLCFGERHLIERGFLTDHFTGNRQIFFNMMQDGVIKGLWRGCIANGLRYGTLGAIYAHDRHFYYYYTVYPDYDSSEPFYMAMTLACQYYAIGTPIEYLRIKMMLDKKSPETKKFSYSGIYSVWQHRYATNHDRVRLFFAHFQPFYINFMYNLVYRTLYFGLYDYHIVHTYQRSEGVPKKTDIFLTAWATTAFSQLVVLPFEFYRFMTITTERYYNVKFRPFLWLPILRELIQSEQAEGKRVIQRYLRQLPLSAIPGAMMLTTFTVLMPFFGAYVEDFKEFYRYLKEDDKSELFNHTIPGIISKLLNNPGVQAAHSAASQVLGFFKPAHASITSLNDFAKEKVEEENEIFEEFKETEKEKLVQYFTTKYPQLDEDSIKELVESAELDKSDRK